MQGGSLRSGLGRLQFGVLAVSLVPTAAGCSGEIIESTELEEVDTERALLLFGKQLPNNLPLINPGGAAATFSTRGRVDLTTPFHQPLGTNGRECGTCHLPGSGWSLTPADAKLFFLLTSGNHPLFRTPEANNPTMDVSTVQARKVAYSMLLDKAVFRRTFNIPATAEFEVTAVDDPYGVATTTGLSVFRRPLATTNLHLINGVAWENRTGAANGDTHAGLISQARGNVTGAQQGTMAPPIEVLEEIVSWETSLATAQLVAFGVGRLDRCGAQGGPEALSAQARVIGPFTIYDAWAGLAAGTCGDWHSNKRRAQIALGQQLFNTAVNASGGRCIGCHNVANNGTNFNGTLFDVGVSAGSRRTADLPLYTLRNKTTGELRQSTDPGRAMISGRWSDVDRFKAPTLRGLAARAPYFHNGMAATLLDVVRHYEAAQGFNFSEEEEAALVAFMKAL
jgi:cytochrome c peroxidase